MDAEKSQKAYQIVDGAAVPYNFKPELVRECLNYAAKENDIYIVTFPKCGTTWLEVMTFGVLNNGKAFDEDIDDYFVQTPFLEGFGPKAIDKMKRRGTIKTHLSLEHVPYHPKAKYIYVVRDPRDVCVSFYHFAGNIPITMHYQQTFASFYDEFLRGETMYGDYFQHLESIGPKMNSSNLLVLSYEKIQRNFRSTICDLSQFLDVKLDDQVIDKIVKVSSFEYMKHNYDKSRNAFDEQQPEEIRIFPFQPLTIVRKGAVGDYQSLLTASQVEKLLERARQVETAVPGLKVIWDDK